MKKGKIKLYAGILAFCLAFVPVAGKSEGITGQFDYYVMALSWSPNWCNRTGRSQGSPQCKPARQFGWILHGLWPQYEQGWPSYCSTDFADPTFEKNEDMTDIMGSASLADYEWRKHGTCSGVGADQYFALSRDAFESVVRPEVFRTFQNLQEVSAKSVRQAFLDANPVLKPDMLTVTCKSGQIQEVRICLTKALTPRPCGRDVRQDCTLDNALMYPVR